jgi:hypothetical protein
MTEIVTLCLWFASLPVVFWAGHEWGKRRYRAPLTKAEHTDEYLYLKDGVYVPYQPPKYVPEGMSPVAATWAMNRETGIMHHTRRVEP